MSNAQLREVDLTLASCSPQRLALLRQLGLRPRRVVPVVVDERPLPREQPRQLALRLARAKCSASAEAGAVLAADTIVACGRRGLGKPLDEAQARAFLLLLSGRRHRVWTAVMLRTPAGTWQRLSCSRLAFKRLSPTEIEAYLATQEWRESAGGYRIQGQAESFVRFLSGSYSGVAGLPLFETRQLLATARLL